ncbi:MAG: DUF3883 domain-containing protein [Candidatus Pacebacteria bacterium]|nr:DUF3883 domain-containing protein [Candidatus Paceibacterota bacterium]
MLNEDGITSKLVEMYFWQLGHELDKEAKGQSTPYFKMYFNPYLLEKYFEQWKEHVSAKDGKPFVSFSESPFLRREEGYKDDIEREANRILAYDLWKKQDVGTGKILTKVIESIRFPKNSVVNNNNLVFTSRMSYGDVSLPYRQIQDLHDKKDFAVEQLFFDFFSNSISDGDAFERIVAINGKRFAVPAYLLFIKNKRKYVPVAPVRFEQNLTALGAHISLSHHCEWDVYRQFLEHVSYVRDFLAERIAEEVRLLDAHSFLWMVNGVGRTEHGGVVLKSVTVSLVSIDANVQLSYHPSTNHDSEVFSQDSLDAKQARNKTRGAWGEVQVYEAERDRLVREGHQALADRVMMVSDNVSLGYDILSYASNGSERHIEVKTTQNGSTGSLTFFISSHELQRALDDPQFRLCFVLYNGDAQIKILYLDESLDADIVRKILTPRDECAGVLFVPKNYMVKIALRG